MELTQLISWAFQALLLGGAGILIYEIRDLRKRDNQMAKQINDLEKKIAERYVTRSELNTHIAGVVSGIERIIDDLKAHLEVRFKWLEKMIDKKT